MSKSGIGIKINDSLVFNDKVTVFPNQTYDELVEAVKRAYTVNKDDLNPAHKQTSINGSCEHSSKRYIGLTQVYDYCDKCNQKLS